MEKEEKIEFIKAWIKQNENAIKMGNEFLRTQQIEINKAEMRITYLKNLLKEATS